MWLLLYSKFQAWSQDPDVLLSRIDSNPNPPFCAVYDLWFQIAMQIVFI